jgi:hypothetical protein
MSLRREKAKHVGILSSRRATKHHPSGMKYASFVSKPRRPDRSLRDPIEKVGVAEPVLTAEDGRWQITPQG